MAFGFALKIVLLIVPAKVQHQQVQSNWDTHPAEAAAYTELQTKSSYVQGQVVYNAETKAFSLQTCSLSPEN
jgi:hypothetical protein